MGFKQYHEPADELPSKTRTFARIIVSLTEKAEAINWYEQRMAIEKDKSGCHYAGSTSPGDINQHGDEAEEESD
jgi:hypothetical protein